MIHFPKFFDLFNTVVLALITLNSMLPSDLYADSCQGSGFNMTLVGKGIFSSYQTPGEPITEKDISSVALYAKSDCDSDLFEAFQDFALNCQSYCGSCGSSFGLDGELACPLPEAYWQSLDSLLDELFNSEWRIMLALPEDVTTPPILPCTEDTTHGGFHHNNNMVGSDSSSTSHIPVISPECGGSIKATAEGAIDAVCLCGLTKY